MIVTKHITNNVINHLLIIYLPSKDINLNNTKYLKDQERTFQEVVDIYGRYTKTINHYFSNDNRFMHLINLYTTCK